MTVPQAFDSLLPKLTTPGASRTEALERARRALDECVVGGMPTVLTFHRAVVRDPAFTDEPFRVHTRWIETEFDGAIEPWSGPAPGQLGGQGDGPPPRERITVEGGGKRLGVGLPTGVGVGDGGGAGARAGAGRAAGGAQGPGGWRAGRAAGRAGGGRADGGPPTPRQTGGDGWETRTMPPLLGAGAPARVRDTKCGRVLTARHRPPARPGDA